MRPREAGITSVELGACCYWPETGCTGECIRREEDRIRDERQQRERSPVNRIKTFISQLLSM